MIIKDFKRIIFRAIVIIGATIFLILIIPKKGHKLQLFSSSCSAKTPNTHKLSKLKWDFCVDPVKEDGSDGLLMSEKLDEPLWDASVYQDPCLPHPVCNKTDPLSLIIVINSALSHFDRRIHIRATWGLSQGEELSGGETFKVFFAVGRSDNETLEELLQEESDKYGDIIMGNFIDNYRNNTLKTMYSHYFIMDECKFRFILKSDDDCFINVPNILSNLKFMNSMSLIYLGLTLNSKAHRAVVRPTLCRNPYFCKWNLQKEDWPFKFHVKFARGMGVLLSQMTARILLNNYRYVSPVHTDDPYTGYVLKRAGIGLCEAGGMYGEPKEYTNVCDLNYVYIVHYIGHQWPISIQRQRHCLELGQMRQAKYITSRLAWLLPK